MRVASSPCHLELQPLDLRDEGRVEEGQLDAVAHVLGPREVDLDDVVAAGHDLDGRAERDERVADGLEDALDLVDGQEPVLRVVVARHGAEVGPALAEHALDAHLHRLRR